ncbi:hypothetical protein ABZX75_29115 [Streptomyces sp. NPDC003038]|uniref:hypothetical protein n=1 Tax=unclassified Streptomyces TaxID=2593676 RepID=UPI0033A7B0F5
MTESSRSANSKTSTADSEEKGSSPGRARTGAAKSATRGVSTAAESSGHLTSVVAPVAERTKTVAHTARKSVGSATRHTLGKAAVAWTVVKGRKVIALGAMASTVAVTAGSYAVGRRAGLRRRGPLSRLTGGRL